MVRMGSPVRFRRGAPPQTSSSGRVQHPACPMLGEPRTAICQRFARNQGLSSLKERGRSIPTRKILWVLCAVPSVQAGSPQPADGVNGGAPAAQPGHTTLGRQGLTQDRRGAGRLPGSMASFGWGVEAGGSSIASNRWPWAARARVPVIGSPRQGGMELCGRSRAGASKRATTPPGGVMTDTSTRRLRPSRSHRLSWRQAADLAVAQAMKTRVSSLGAAATRPTAGGPPVGDAVEPGGLLAGCGEPLGGLDRGPADQPGPCLVMGPRRTVVSDSR
jgi:hypothetical protein